MDTQKAVEKVEKIANMLCTAHAMMRDGYSLKNKLMGATAVILSAVIITFFLWSDSTVGFFRDLGVELTQEVISACGVMLAFLNIVISILILVWQPAELASQHQRALEHYTRVKHRSNNLLKSKKITLNELTDLQEMHEGRGLIGIADSKFNKLKQKHLQKMHLSSLLDKKPFVPLWYVKLCLTLNAMHCDDKK